VKLPLKGKTGKHDDKNNTTQRIQYFLYCWLEYKWKVIRLYGISL